MQGQLQSLLLLALCFLSRSPDVRVDVDLVSPGKAHRPPGMQRDASGTHQCLPGESYSLTPVEGGGLGSNSRQQAGPSVQR